jgi:hypothetical protein
MNGSYSDEPHRHHTRPRTGSSVANRRMIANVGISNRRSGEPIIAPQRSNSAHLHRTWRTTLCPRSPIGRGPALNAGKCRFEACRGYASVAQLAEAAASRAACCRFESCAAHQLIAPFAKRQRHLAYTQTFGGSSPSGSTNQNSKRASLVRDARAAADNRVAGAFSGKVGTGFPSENATTQKDWGSSSRLHQSGREALNPNGEGADF